MFYKPLNTLGLTTTESGKPAKTSRRQFLKEGLALAATALAGGTSACSLGGLAPEGDVKTCYDEMDALLSSRPNAIKYSDETIIAPYNPEKPMYVKYDDIPPQLIASILVREDPGFFDYNGWDPDACSSAALNNQIKGSRRGCSGITMQVVKWLMKGEKDIDWTKKGLGKATQMSLADRLAGKYSKEQIIEAYLNVIEFSSGNKGILAAANRFFGITDLNDLTLYQCAYLSANLKKPGERNPYDDDDNSQPVRNVLERLIRDPYPDSMVTHLGMDRKSLISTAQATSQNIPIQIILREDGTDAFIKWFRDNHMPPDTYTTTLNPAVQKAAHATLKRAFEDLKKSHGVDGCSIMVMNRKGDVLGTSSTKGHNAFSATDQVGSLLKPLLLGVLAEKLITAFPKKDKDELYQALLDIQIDNSPMLSHQGNFWPKDSSDAPDGATLWPRGGGPESPVNLREALQKSYNGVWARLISLPTPINVTFNSDPSSTNTLNLNPEDLKNSLQTLLQDTGLTDKPITPAVITGSLASSIAKIARVYAGFLNGGIVRTKANAIKDSGGLLFSPTESDNETYKLFSPEAADIVKRFLRLPLEEGGTAFKSEMDIPENAGAKTGTTDDYKNAWCVYLVGDYVVVMSVRKDNNKNLVGGNLAGYVRGLGDRLTTLLNQ